jgi:hypothetical protein
VRSIYRRWYPSGFALGFLPVFTLAASVVGVTVIAGGFGE